MRMDLPYAVALRDFFGAYKMRAQENTRYMESDGRDATVSHVMNLMISRLTSADIQSTITPDEGRNVPWHYNNVAAVNTAKQSLVGMDGLREMVKLDREAPELKAKVREIKERAILFLEAMLEDGGYFAAVEQAYFVDSGIYPETHDDGIARKSDGGVAAGTIVERAADYLAPVCHHFGENHLPEGYGEAGPAAPAGPAPGPQALRPHRRLHPVRRRQGPVHRRARPRGQRQRAPGPDGRAAREGPAQAGGGVGRRRLGRGDACSSRPRRASRRPRPSSSAGP